VNTKSLAESSGAPARLLEMLIVPALAAHLLVCFLLAREPLALEGNAAPRAELRGSVDAAREEERPPLVDRYDSYAGLSTSLALAVIRIVTGNAPLERVSYDLLLESLRRIGTLETLPRSS